MSTLFDPASFMSAALNEANETKRVPAPVADQVPAQIVAATIKTGEKDGRTWAQWQGRFEITDPGYLAEMPVDPKPEKITLSYEFFLDLTEQNTLAFGQNKNIKLGKLREATGCNLPGKSLNDIVGQMVRVKVGHRVNQEDGTVYEEIKGVIKY